MKSGFVALAGRPNAGKSTLLNGLLNEKLAIVSDKPQTTRSQIRGILNMEDAQIIFTDTPGIHKARHRLETRMNREAAEVISGVDLIYLVIDGTQAFGKGDEYVLRMVKNAGVPVFLILNKTDRMKPEKIMKVLQSWQQRFDFAEYFPISALKDGEFADLVRTTLDYLPEGERMYPEDMSSDGPLRFRIAEAIREKILYCTEEEVPHSAAVIVETLEEEDDICYIQALVLVEKQGQKGILIGKQGRMLQKIIGLAEKDLRELTGMKTKLELFVRVEEEWREKDAKITEYGYGITDE